MQIFHDLCSLGSKDPHPLGIGGPLILAELDSYIAPTDLTSSRQFKHGFKLVEIACKLNLDTLGPRIDIIPNNSACMANMGYLEICLEY